MTRLRRDLVRFRRHLYQRVYQRPSLPYPGADMTMADPERAATHCADTASGAAGLSSLRLLSPAKFHSTQAVTRCARFPLPAGRSATIHWNLAGLRPAAPAGTPSPARTPLARREAVRMFSYTPIASMSAAMQGSAADRDRPVWFVCSFPPQEHGSHQAIAAAPCVFVCIREAESACTRAARTVLTRTMVRSARRGGIIGRGRGFAHGLTRKSWAGVPAAGPVRRCRCSAFSREVRNFTGPSHIVEF